MNQSPKSHEKRMPGIRRAAMTAVALILVLLLAVACGGEDETKAPGAENAEPEETLPAETVVSAETEDATPEPAGPEGTDMPKEEVATVMAVTLTLTLTLLLAAAGGGGEETKAPGAENAAPEETLPTETVVSAETEDATPEPAGPEGTDMPKEEVATEQKPSLIPSTEISERPATEQKPSLIPSIETSENQREARNIEELIAMLPADEQECLPDAVKQVKDSMAANTEDGSLHEEPLREQALQQLMDCFSDKSIALVMAIPRLEEDGGELSQETKDCISNGATGSLLKKIITEIADIQNSENPEEATQRFMAMTMGMMLSTSQCLNEEESTKMGTTLQERDALSCMTGGDPENSSFVEDFIEAMITQDEEALATFEKIREECYAMTGVPEVPEGTEPK